MDRQHNGSFARVGYVVSQELVKISSLLPSNKSRSFVVHSLIKCLGLLASPPPECGGQAYGPAEPTLRIVRPRLASVQELCLYHDRDYVEFVLMDGRIGNTSGDGVGDGDGVGRVDALASEFGIEDDCPPFVGMGRYVQLVAGSTLCAVDVLKSGEVDVAIAWDGGRHHAQKGRAAGFCYVADCILAILSLKRAFTSTLSGHPASASERKTRKPRVMYLDLDLHFSDAVSECFYKLSGSQGNASSQVLTLSIHYTAPGFYPPHPLASLPNPAASTGTSDESTPSNNNNNMEFDPFTLSLPLKQGASSRTFTRIWPIVERVKDVFSPDYVIVQCGTDGLAGDPHGIWNWNIGGGVGVGSESSESEKGSLDWCVGEVVNKWGVKVLLLGGGGYNSPNTARAWAKLTSVVLKRYIPSDTPIPDHSAFPLYAPSFTLDVPAGNMRDENSEEYLRGVEEVYSVVIERLRERCVGV